MCYDKINIEFVSKERPQDISTNSTTITIIDNPQRQPLSLPRTRTPSTPHTPSTTYPIHQRHHSPFHANLIYSTKYCRQKYVIISCFTMTLLVMIYFLVQIMNGLNDANLPLLTKSMNGINNKLTSLKQLSIHLGTLNSKLDQISNSTIMNQNFKINEYSYSTSPTSFINNEQIQP